MDKGNMRNIVILKNLPSNLVEEAFIVLKKSQKIKKKQLVENKNNNFEYEIERQDENDFIVKEAEMLVSNYITKLENEDICNTRANYDLNRKYKKLKKISMVLSGFLILAFSIIFIA